jgi:thiol-disulfide isomerase/thioredoxin/Tfp pilus assembly protein PilF
LRNLLLSLFLVALPLSADTLSVRQLYAGNDPDAAIRAFSTLAAPAEEDRAFAVAAYAMTGRTSAANRELAVLEAQAPGKPWTLFAAAAIAANGDEQAVALQAARRMMAAAGDHPDEEMVRQLAVLLGAEKYEEAQALLAKSPPTLRLRVAKAQIESWRRKDAETAAEIEALRKEAPERADVWLLSARHAMTLRRPDEALPLFKQAVALSTSPRVHADYWRALSSSSLSAEEKKAELERATADLRARRGETPEVWLAIAGEHTRLGNAEAANEWNERVLREAPHTVYASRAMWGRYTAFMKKHGAAAYEDAALRAELKKIVRDYLEYQTDEEDIYRRGGYSALFGILKADPQAGEAELVEAVQGMSSELKSDPQTAASVATLLATRNVRLDLAEEIARRGYDAYPAFAAPIIQGGGDEPLFLAKIRAIVHDALGWVMLQRGQTEAARNQLFAAYELDPENALVLYHLGRWYESRKEYDKAEQRYRRGAAMQMAEKNPSETALRDLYQKRHGTIAGYDAYRTKAEKTGLVARRSKVLAARRKSAPPALDFKLKTLDGREVSLASLKGKTVVMNFWGVWCGWCVREMPEYQQLSKKYASDPSVAILTINNDSDVASVRKWMAEQKYDFAVLLDDGFVRRNKIEAFPTTWFLDRKGRVAYEKQGWTQKLLEEFSWRVEELKAER